MILTTTLVGARFRPATVRGIIAHIDIGEAIELEADPFNEHDDSAVKCLYEGTHIGFIPRTMNKEVFTQLILGNEVTCEVIAFENSITPILEVRW